MLSRAALRSLQAVSVAVTLGSAYWGTGIARERPPAHLDELLPGRSQVEYSLSPKLAAALAGTLGGLAAAAVLYKKETQHYC